MSNEEKCLLLEQRLQRDEGRRGIAAILPASPSLYQSSINLLGCSNIVILTGFPCLFNNPIKIETDGIAGALALARTLNHLNKNVTILIESEFFQVLKPVIDWHNEKFGCDVLLDCSLELKPDGVIAIERAGRAADGNYYTMRALRMENVTQFDTVYLDQLHCRVKVAIGDGGNEAGLGPLQEKVRKSILNGEVIASCSFSDFVIVSSVSTWGGYGLALGISAVAGMVGEVSVNGELEVAQRIMESGICDGITGKASLGVDGMEWDVTRGLIEDLIRIVG